ncbi:hypothetical protein HK102_002952 [Quaeritorhiza haematococci]|nr:hypothetical protein HK102_002952 [Quaeritorhiza haematococci]
MTNMSASTQRRPQYSSLSMIPFATNVRIMAIPANSVGSSTSAANSSLATEPGPSSSSSWGPSSTTTTPTSTNPPIRVPTVRSRIPEYLLHSPISSPLDDDLTLVKPAEPTEDAPTKDQKASTQSKNSLENNPLAKSMLTSLHSPTSSSNPAGEKLKGSPLKFEGGLPRNGQDGVTGKFPSMSLPTSWSTRDKCNLLILSKGNLRVSYNGTGNKDADAAAVRANYPIPPQCGVFYYEVDIVSKGRDGYIGIGFCTKSVNLQRLPGWEENSWGYHGDDGHSFCCSGTGKPYGPTFTTGDIIGCGINFATNEAFYTKNGVYLGVAFRNLKSDLYPSVGFRTPGEIVEANFGHRKFEFDIEQYCKEERQKQWQSINAGPLDFPNSSTPPDTDDTGAEKKSVSKGKSAALSKSGSSAQGRNDGEKLGVHDLVLSYLVHHGFVETAEVFHRDAIGWRSQILQSNQTVEPGIDVDSFGSNVQLGVGALSQESSSIQDIPLLPNMGQIMERQRIRSSVLSGDIDEAIRLTNALYPTVLKENPDILFHLKCQKFIELIRNSCLKKTNDLSDPGDSTTDNQPDDDTEEDDEEDGGTRKESVAGGDQGADDMDIDVESGSGGGSQSTAKSRKRRVRELKGVWRKIVEYGQDMQIQYANDEREEIRKCLVVRDPLVRDVFICSHQLTISDVTLDFFLQDTFSLIAYADPAECPNSYLLDPAGREPVANALNSAILVSQGEPAIPAVELLYRQARLVVGQLVRQGVGSASLIDVQKDCLVK